MKSKLSKNIALSSKNKLISLIQEQELYYLQNQKENNAKLNVFRH